MLRRLLSINVALPERNWEIEAHDQDRKDN